ncbi:MAG: exonuclease SbcCD subunit D [Parasporobacterium sp.]|nr:exonuclease SbcCD subunit D [Parasporobacterium sp.]
MKLLHLADLHLGRSLGEFDLIEDQRYILQQILEIIQRESVDAVLIAGDVYDKSIPSEAAVNLLDSFLYQLARQKTAVYMISGNHDSDDRLNFGSSLFRSSRIFICAAYRGTLSRYTQEDEYGAVNIYLLPFVKASYVKHFFPEEPIRSYEDAVNVIIKHAGIDPDGRNVIAAHQFVAGKEESPRLGGSEGMSAQNVGLVERIGYDCFDPFDYAALGHIHSPQQVGRKQVRYSGSPLKYSLSEVNNAKSVPLITLKEKGQVQVEQIPLKPMRDLRHLKGRMEQLLDKSAVTDPEDFIYATLTDEEVINDAMGIFQQIYPNTVRIDYDNSHTRELEKPDLSGMGEERSFPELIRDFYQLMYGCGISEEEMKIMKEAAQEAGVTDETD